MLWADAPVPDERHLIANVSPGSKEKLRDLIMAHGAERAVAADAAEQLVRILADTLIDAIFFADASPRETKIRAVSLRGVQAAKKLLLALKQLDRLESDSSPMVFHDGIELTTSASIRHLEGLRDALVVVAADFKTKKKKNRPPHFAGARYYKAVCKNWMLLTGELPSFGNGLKGKCEVSECTTAIALDMITAVSIAQLLPDVDLTLNDVEAKQLLTNVVLTQYSKATFTKAREKFEERSSAQTEQNNLV